MKYNDFLGERVSALGFGAMRLPCSDDGKIIFSETDNMIEKLYNEGVNYFDTAWMYHGGESEKVIGRSLKRFPRSSYYLADKMPVWFCQKPDEVPSLFETQLERCGVDYFDFYLVHSVSYENWGQVEEFDVIPFLLKMKSEGKIKHLGFSFHADAKLLTEILDKYDCFEFVQLQLNYFDWDFSGASELHKIAVERNLPIIVMEPVRGGLLADLGESNKIFTDYAPNMSVASWAIRYAMNLQNVAVVLSGMSNEEQALDNLKNADSPKLNSRELELIQNADRKFKDRIFIPCTGCRYCMECTVGINIPEIFKLYNNFCTTASWNQGMLIEEYPKLHGEAECIECGQCQSHCPQHINIINELKMIEAKYLELKG